MWQVAARIKCNLPFLTAAKLDMMFCQYVLAVLIEMQLWENKKLLVS